MDGAGGDLEFAEVKKVKGEPRKVKTVKSLGWNLRGS